MFPKPFRQTVSFAVGSALVVCLGDAAEAEGLTPGELSDLQRRLERYDAEGWHEPKSCRFLPGAFDDVCVLIRILNRSDTNRKAAKGLPGVNQLFWLFAAIHLHDELLRVVDSGKRQFAQALRLRFGADPTRSNFATSLDFVRHNFAKSNPKLIEQFEQVLALCDLRD